MKRPIDEVRVLAERLGRPPTVSELKRYLSPVMLKEIIGEFGTYDNLVGALNEPKPEKIESGAGTNKYRKICSRKEQIQGFFRHVLDLDDLFDRAGNPEILRLVAQPDTHVKFMFEPAVNAFLKFCQWYEPNIHMIMGDFADCEGIAHWEPHNLAPRRIVPEMKIARALLRKTVEHTPTCSTRIYLEGNHEYWIQLAMTRMPEFFDEIEELGIEINLKTLLALEKFGYEMFPLNHLVKIGRAHFTHGIFTQQHHAKKHLDVFKGNIYYGHLHDKQSHNQTSLDGDMEAASLGCLCRLDAQFLKGKPNNWSHNFGIFEFFRDGQYTFLRPDIRNGRLAIMGKIFDGNQGS